MRTLVLFLLVFLAGPVGQATYYGPGLMEKTFAYRLRAGDVQRCRECIDYVALLDPEHIGKKVWLRHPSGEVVGPLLVIDCARRRDAPALRRRDWVVDVSYTLGFQHWKMRGPLAGVEVLWRPPPRPEPGKPHVKQHQQDDAERPFGRLRAR